MLGLLVGITNPRIGAQETSDKVHLSGALQSDILIPEKDPTIGANTRDGYILTNTLKLEQGWST